MTANQRRPGFRLPWSPESEEAGSEESVATVAADAGAETGAAADGGTDAAATGQPAPEGATTSADQEPHAELPAEAAATTAEGGGDEFMHDLVAAMRGVAQEAREAGVSDLRGRADEEVRRLEADAQRRQEDLRQRAEADVAGIGEWERAEAERITTEAEQRRVARRAQLDQQLAADSTRTDAETKAVRDRVAEYERELDSFSAQLGDINDPAAFAAAAKRMPRPPSLTGAAQAPPPAAAPAAAQDAPAPEAAATAPEASAMPVTEASAPEASTPEAHAEATTAPAEQPEAPAAPPADEALAARLASLDASASGNGASAAPAGSGDAVTTEVIVKGLGSFGAITGFRQSLSNVDGIDGVALSLGQTGEFVFRASHAAGFDLRSAIVALEGDGAKVEDRPEGGLRVTLERAR